MPDLEIVLRGCDETIFIAPRSVKSTRGPRADFTVARATPLLAKQRRLAFLTTDTKQRGMGHERGKS